MPWYRIRNNRSRVYMEGEFVCVVQGKRKINLIQAVNNFTRILQSLSDNFGTDVPDERVRVCLEIAGSVDNFEHALQFLESKILIDVVAVYNLRTGEMLNYPVLKEKTQRMIKTYGVEDILIERKPVKW